jgi:hypothetical protein
VKRVPDATMPRGEVRLLLGADVGEALPLLGAGVGDGDRVKPSRS